MADKMDRSKAKPGTGVDIGPVALPVRPPLAEVFFMYVVVLLAAYFLESLIQQSYGWKEFAGAWQQYFGKPDPQAQVTDLLNLSLYAGMGWFVWTIKYLVPPLALAAAAWSKATGRLEVCAWRAVAVFGVALAAAMCANVYAWDVIHHSFFK